MTGLGCKSPIPSPTTLETPQSPWADTQRADEKTRLAEYVAQQPDGVPLPKIVRDVFNGYSATDAQLARRFFDRHDEFKIDRRGQYQWVEPTPALFTCTAGKQKIGTQDGVGDAQTTGQGDGTRAVAGGADPSRPKGDRPDVMADGEAETTGTVERDQYAKDRAQALLSKSATVQADSVRADLRRELGTELASIADRVTVLERVRGSGPEYLFLPHKTRFSDEGRAHELKRNYDRAWDRATAEYETAVAATLTTDPRRHDSIAAATDALLENFRRLHGDFFTYDPQTGPSRPGRRLDYLWTLEFTDSGLPHLHVVFFGVSWLCPHATLSQYWSETRDQGHIVYLQRLHQRGGRWVPTGDVDGYHGTATDGEEYAPTGGRGTRAYFGKQIATLVSVAEEDTADGVTERDAHGEREKTAGQLTGNCWKLALYWALGKQFWSGSQALTGDKSADAESDYPHVACYRFVGVAQYGTLPAHVRAAGRLFDGYCSDRSENRSEDGEWTGTGPPDREVVADGPGRR